jgi:1-acyl-sn-glycerol-3-phosphate acyltransferase
VQPIVIDKPYTFIPPHRGTFWPRLLQHFLRRRLQRAHGIDQVECQGLDRLRDSLAAGYGVMLTPNHCRPADPFLVAEVCHQAGALPFMMASWHVFMQSQAQSWLLRRTGAFSIYREGMDRAAINTAIGILASGNRPLVLFPEGVINRTNDRLGALMEGVSLIARAAAKQRAAATPPSQVVVHPIALRYHFRGDPTPAIAETLTDLERSLSWQPQRDLPLVERMAKLAHALLALKELEYLGATQAGSLFERLERLIDSLLEPLEKEWLGGTREKNVVARVKKLRIAVLPDMVQGEISEAERQRRWRQLADMYLAQQLSFYPPDYIGADPSPDRLLETAERFEEDLTDKCRRYAPMSAIATIGEAIPVSPARERGAAEDPLMTAIETQLKSMLKSTAPTLTATSGDDS